MIEKIRGLVRPAVMLMFTGCICYGFLKGKIDWVNMIAIYGPMLGYWFGERSALKGIVGEK